MMQRDLFNPPIGHCIENSKGTGYRYYIYEPMLKKYLGEANEKTNSNSVDGSVYHDSNADGFSIRHLHQC